MKARITFKDPDALIDQLEDTERGLVKTLMTGSGLSNAGAVAEASERMKPLRDLASRYFQYSEYVTIELDSATQTATVMKDRDNT